MEALGFRCLIRKGFTNVVVNTSPERESTLCCGRGSSDCASVDGAERSLDCDLLAGLTGSQSSSANGTMGTTGDTDGLGRCFEETLRDRFFSNFRLWIRTLRAGRGESAGDGLLEDGMSWSGLASEPDSFPITSGSGT